jgi:signal transduction histidine kinase/DNA-binding NarL/FixJ family response regulator
MKSIRLVFFQLLLLCFSAHPLHAQKPEMVPEYEKRLREATTDSARAMILQYLALNLAPNDPKRSLKYGEEALRVAEKSGNPLLLAHCHNGVGWAFFSAGNYDRAKILLDSSIEYNRSIKNYFDLAPACNNQGWVYLKQGDNLTALRYFREGLNAAEASKDKGRIAFMNRTLGSFYNEQEEYEKSIPHIQRALEMFVLLRDTGQIGDCQMSLGNSYSGMGQNETAIEYYKKALPMARQRGDLLGEGLIFENWGIALSQMGRFSEAFAKLEEARPVFERLDEQIELAFLELSIGNTYLKQGDTTKAIIPLEKARKISEERQINDVLTEVLPALHKAYAKVGSPEKAYQTLLAYQTLRDTSAAEVSYRELQRLKTEFETERKEKDLQIKTLENTRLQSRFWLALSGFALALIAGLAFYFRARHRRKTNAVLKAKNQEILAQKAEAERQRERAQHSEAVKEKFLAAMSHEIRTPMNAIVGLSQLLDAEKHAPTTAHNISIIRQSGEYLMTILNDVLDLAKIEADKIELRPQPLALVEHLQFIRDTFDARALEKDIDLWLETDQDLPDFVVTDPVRFGQVLSNLVSNAIKFTNSGEVTISALLAEQTMPQANISAITFSVRDTGIGIPMDKQAVVFEEFMQADTGVALTYGGTGLGLSIARNLVTQMGGELQLRSNPGEGAEFYFTLHLPIASAETHGEQLANLGKTVIPTLDCQDSVHILLVEDNEFNQAVAGQTIGAICPEIYLDIVESGEEALERVKTVSYDLILTDLQMPGIDGYETTRRLRLANFKEPIVALTASAVRTEEQKCLDAGMNEMALKPISPTEMAALLMRYIPEKLVFSSDLKPAEMFIPAPKEATVPAALLHFSGGNPDMARELLGIIRTELSEHLPAIQSLQSAEDAPGIRKIVHKMRPQLIALGLEKHKSLLDAVEQNSAADAAFWGNVRILESVLEDTLSELVL